LQLGILAKEESAMGWRAADRGPNLSLRHVPGILTLAVMMFALLPMQAQGEFRF
jgi:hypothetical protein